MQLLEHGYEIMCVIFCHLPVEHKLFVCFALHETPFSFSVL